MLTVMERNGEYYLIGYECPGCDALSDGRACYDAHDLFMHTMVVTGQDFTFDSCPWCGTRGLAPTGGFDWVKVAQFFDTHLAACSKYKLCCVAGKHPQGATT